MGEILLLYGRIFDLGRNDIYATSILSEGKHTDGTGRVGSGQEVFKSRGSGRVTLTQPDP